MQVMEKPGGLEALGLAVARHAPDLLVMQDAHGLIVERSERPVDGGPGGRFPWRAGGYGYSHGHALRWGYDFLRIDHIYVSPDIDVINSFVAAGDASDHRPVVADLVLPQ